MADDDRGAPAPETGTAAQDGDTAAPDAKARFREALERKQGAAHRSAQGRANTGVVHGSEVTGRGKRTFRRKTG
ncbi:DUF5302 domain-containing protein [Actinotalea solisilvae]|uniref:DUF5302 domain-containing protein n=1 Tax=Actinotalea solisilvae TaxID=2072922 RepID=UPI0018F20FE5|nr:DUF5302 domain-containing protein [Actinotalea solisilvae]